MTHGRTDADPDSEAKTAPLPGLDRSSEPRTVLVSSADTGALVGLARALLPSLRVELAADHRGLERALASARVACVLLDGTAPRIDPVAAARTIADRAPGAPVVVWGATPAARRAVAEALGEEPTCCDDGTPAAEVASLVRTLCARP